MTQTRASMIRRARSPVVSPQSDTLAAAGESSPIERRSARTLLPIEEVQAVVAASKVLDDLGAANGSVWLQLDGCGESATTRVEACAVLLTPVTPEGAAGSPPHSA